MKKKLHIHSDCFYWGGSENMVSVFLQDGQVAETYDISFSYRYSGDYEKGMNKWVTWKDSHVIRYPLRLPVSFIYRIGKLFRPFMFFKYFCMPYEVVRLFFLLCKVKPDVLYVQSGGYFGATSCISSAIAGKLARVPKITYMITSTVKDNWWECPITKVLKWSVDYFVTASKNLKKEASFLDKGNFKTVSNTILRREVRSKEKIRKLLNIDKDELVFVCVGALEERKGFRHAINAFCELKYHSRKHSLWLVGDGPEYESLHVQVAKSQNRRIFFYGKNPFPYEEGISDYEVISMADVLVVPSIRDEDWPNVILLAMLYSTPIVASSMAGIPEMGVMEAGYLVPPGKENDLAIAMNSMFNDTLRAKKSVQAYEYYALNYDRPYIIKKWMDLWDH